MALEQMALLANRMGLLVRLLRKGEFESKTKSHSTDWTALTVVIPGVCEPEEDVSVKTEILSAITSAVKNPSGWMEISKYHSELQKLLIDSLESNEGGVSYPITFTGIISDRCLSNNLNAELVRREGVELFIALVESMEGLTFIHNLSSDTHRLR